MRIKAKPYRSLPKGIAVWDRLLRRSKAAKQKSKPTKIEKGPPVKLTKRDLVLENIATHKTQEDVEIEKLDSKKNSPTNPSSPAQSPVGSPSHNFTNGHDQEDMPLTDLQKEMLKILKKRGGSATIDEIAEEIGKMWGTLRKRDGSRYAADCRRAVSSTLANTSTASPLFIRDPSNEGSWKFGARALALDINDFEEEIVEEYEDAEKEEVIEDFSADDDIHETNEVQQSGAPSIDAQGLPNKKRRSDRVSYSEEKNQESESNSTLRGVKKLRKESIVPEKVSPNHDVPRPFLSRRREKIKQEEANHKEEKEPNKKSPIMEKTPHTPESKSELELTQLQVLMIEAINKNGGSASLDTIHQYVSKYWGNIRRRDGSLYTTDCRKAVKASLSYNTSSAPTFKKDPQREGFWRVATKKSGKKEDNPVTTPVQSPPQVQPEQFGSPKLTDMQDMLMKVILSHGGVATFEEIFDDVVKNKTKRSFRQWGADSKRALLASLSHNPPGNFKKTKDGSWTIAPKAMAVAEELCTEDSSLSMNKIKALQES